MTRYEIVYVYDHGRGFTTARPWGAAEWGYHSGPMEWDAAYVESHANQTNRSE